MQRILRFRPDLSVEPAGDGMIFLVGEHERVLLRGRLHELVAPLVDGRRTVWEIIRTLEDKASPPEVYDTLVSLEKAGYLVEAGPSPSAEAAAFLHALGVDAALATRRLAAMPVAVRAMGGEDPGSLVAALSAAGLAIREDAPLQIVVTGDYLDRGLDAVNRRALRERRRWMPIKPAGATPWIGPMFRPGDGPCWECLAARLRANRPVETFVAHRLAREAPVLPPRAAVLASARAALDLGALTVIRWIADGGRGLVDDKLLALELRTMRIEEHMVQRRPQCPVCGDPDLVKQRAEQPIVLEPRPKRFTEDGGYRSVTPEETCARYAHLVSPITGVVASIGPVPGRDHPLRPVHGATFFVCPPADRTPRFDEFSRASLGKGRTAAQARAGALCEAIERYSAAVQGDEPRIRSRMSALGGEAVHPHVLLNFSDAQYRSRDELNAGTLDRRRIIPVPFDPAVAIEWVPVWSLTTGNRRYLPAAYCYLGLPAPPDERFCDLDPSGHAAGNCLEEAILQAFLELVERDAVGIWWYNRVRRPAVDLRSFEERYFTALEDHYRSMGYRLWVLDISSDLEIPAFVALARSIENDRWCLGFGCHLEARLGVQRALTELNQLFDPTGTARAPWGNAPMEDESFLAPDSAAPPGSWGDAGEAVRGDLRACVEACVRRAARLGLEVLVLDQTRPDIGLPAVKVVVPGLRHMWPRLGPGRLFSAPVRLGWLDRARAEAELNRTPLYI
jgi:ribosomal protein S12 methylthiotransferase accessory factor